MTRPFLPTIGREGTSDESDGNAVDDIDRTPPMDDEIRPTPCGDIARRPAFQQPAMVLMIAIDDMEGHGESAWPFMEEFVKDLGEEAEIADLDGRFDPITTFACKGKPIAALPVVDPWQAALDVIGDPQRGIEQAAAIANSLWSGHS